MSEKVTHKVPRSTILISSFALAAVLIGFGFTLHSISVKQRYQRITEAGYARAFTELCDYMVSISTSLQKSLYVTSPEQMVGLTSDLFRQSGGAKSALGQLPLKDTSIDNMQKFLAQSGDYVYSLTRKVMDKQEISADERKNLEKLYEYSDKLSSSLVSMENGITAARAPGAVLTILRSDLDKNVESFSNFGDVEQIFTDYPRMIYDGPFSEHISTKPYAFTDSLKEVTREQAQKKAADFMGVPNDRVKFNGKSEGTLERYVFTAGNEFIEMTVKGGCVYSYLRDYSPDAETISDEEALAKAKAFLVSKGINNMTQTYYVSEDGVLLANFAAKQGDVVCYTDLIKVGVELSGGEVVMYEPGGYLQNHREREIPQPAITLEQAKERISPSLEIGGQGMAIIPTQSKDEAYCYEFKCKNAEGKELISYINAMNGKEQDVVIIIDTGRGKLSM